METVGFVKSVNLVKGLSILVIVIYIIALFSTLFFCIVFARNRASSLGEFYCFNDWVCPRTVENARIPINLGDGTTYDVEINKCYSQEFNDINSGLSYCLVGNGNSVPCNTSSNSKRCECPYTFNIDENACAYCKATTDGSTDTIVDEQGLPLNGLYGCSYGGPSCLQYLVQSQDIKEGNITKCPF